MYKLYLFKTDGHTAKYDYKTKPTFDDMYSMIGCNMIEMSTAYIPELSNKKDGYVNIFMDEESKLKDMPTVNIKITEAWSKWLSKTGRQCLPGDFIAGKVCVYQKVSEEAA